MVVTALNTIIYHVDLQISLFDLYTGQIWHDHFQLFVFIDGVTCTFLRQHFQKHKLGRGKKLVKFRAFKTQISSTECEKSCLSSPLLFFFSLNKDSPTQCHWPVSAALLSPSFFDPVSGLERQLAVQSHHHFPHCQHSDWPWYQMLLLKPLCL